MIAAQQRNAKRIDRAFSSRYNVENPLSGSNSVVECDLAKVEVAGSTPVSRSKVYFSSQISNGPPLSTVAMSLPSDEPVAEPARPVRNNYREVCDASGVFK